MNLLYLISLLVVVVLFVVLFIANIRYWRPVIFNRLSLIYILATLSTCFYIGRVVIDGNSNLVLLNKIFIVLSALTMVGSCVFYYYFVLKQTGRTFKNAKFWYISSFGLLLAVAVIFISSCWTGWAFSIVERDGGSYYQSGLWFFVMLIACYAYILCGIVFAFLKCLQSDLLSERHKFSTMALAIIPTVVFSIVNNFFPYPEGFPLVFYGIFISLLIMFASSSAGRVTRDILTGLLNRFAFDTLLAQAMKRTNKTPQTSLWLLMLDINGFKSINDTYGHPVGDEVLIKFSSAAQSVCERYNATLGRWGGDEFVIYIEAEDSKVVELDRVLKETILKECNDDKRFVVSVSIGAAKLREYESMKHLFEEADHKLYEDKRKFHQEEAIAAEEAKKQQAQQ